MESRIFNCVKNDDVEGLKLFIYYWNYPKIFQIEDASGYNILQRAIWNQSIAVFDFLLSLDNCPINACNSEGKTALEVVLIDPQFGKDEHFTYSLLKKGANIDSIGDTEILCIAVRCMWIDVAQYLIEKGVDINCYCDSECSETPLHILNDLGIDGANVEDLLAMMLCFGANPLIPDYKSFKPIDYFFSNGYLTHEMQEHLVFYVFDDYCTNYVIPTRSLFDLIKSDPPFTLQVLKHITSVYVYDEDDEFPIECFFLDLFRMKVEYLKWLLDKFDYVVQSVIEACLERYNESHDAGEAFSNWSLAHIENFYLLLQSEFNSDLIQLINKTRIIKYMIKSRDIIPRSELFELILVALSYGAILYDEDLEVIYETWGDCEFFRILLHMDIKVKNRNRRCRGIMPCLLYDIHMDIETYLSDPDKCECSRSAVKHLLNYFADPKLKSFCFSLAMENEDICYKVKNLPSVPFLVELARSVVRKFLIEKYKIENSRQFYTLIKHLPISKIHQKIITLETKLY